MATTQNNTMIHSLKIVIMSSCALFIAILLSLFFNHHLFTSGAASSELRSSLGTWLRPPYLYVIINAIIITIAASSRFHHAPPPPEDTFHAPPNVVIIPALRAEQLSPYHDDDVVSGSYYGDVLVKDVVDVETGKSAVPPGIEEVKAEFEVPEIEKMVAVDEMSTWAVLPWPSARQNTVDTSPELVLERPPASSRFAHHRRPAKASPADQGGRALRRVSKPKRHETLENTWKAITEGRAMPLTRHLKKSETWQNQNRQINIVDPTSDDSTVKKSETFTDRTNYNPPLVMPPLRLKERSLSQDELNRRVEAFINKFNEEMRLQRQQSVEQFMDKINRI